MRALRLLGVTVLYVLALRAKEIAVTLPATLVLLELAGAGARRTAVSSRVALSDMLRRDGLLYLVLAAALLAYLAVRVSVLGSIRGERVP